MSFSYEKPVFRFSDICKKAGFLRLRLVLLILRKRLFGSETQQGEPVVQRNVVSDGLKETKICELPPSIKT